MRTGIALGAAAGAVATASLLFVIPSQAGAAATNQSAASTAGCVAGCSLGDEEAFYRESGYMFGQKSDPDPTARIFHVKLRGHTHTLQFTVYGVDGHVLDVFPEQRGNSENAWFDPTKVSKVQITLADRPPVTAPTDVSHCYFEDKHGDLASAGGPCNTA